VDAFDHGLWIPACEVFDDKTLISCVTFATNPADPLPPHLRAPLGRWSACLAKVLHKPTTLPDIHDGKRAVLAVDDGCAMLITVL
jgi:hypothetical protein